MGFTETYNKQMEAHKATDENLKKFEVGKTYQTRSICDDDCIWSVKILKRTKKFISIKVEGDREIRRVGVRYWDNVERADFLGSYSMSPRISADKEIA